MTAGTRSRHSPTPVCLIQVEALDSLYPDEPSASMRSIVTVRSVASRGLPVRVSATTGAKT